MGCAVTSQGWWWWWWWGGRAVEIKAKRQTSEVRQASVDGRPLVAEAGGRCSSCCRSPLRCAVAPCGAGTGVSRPRCCESASTLAEAVAAAGAGGQGSRCVRCTRERHVAVFRVAYCSQHAWSYRASDTCVRPSVGLSHVYETEPRTEPEAARSHSQVAIERAGRSHAAVQPAPR